MKHRARKVKLYTVVEVWRGIAADARTFVRLQDAEKFMQRACRRCNLLEDDVKLFQKSIRISSAS
jgi:hypothetical protein